MKKLIRNLHLRIDDHTLVILKSNKDNLESKSKKKISASEYIRQLIHRDHLELIGIDKEQFKDCNRKLAGIGNNINQIAHFMNMGIFDEKQIYELEKCMKEVSDIRKVIMSMGKDVM